MRKERENGRNKRFFLSLGVKKTNYPQFLIRSQTWVGEGKREEGGE
jgi:hypothetical protein